ncbi:N-acetylmuramoyl-L-alanine amidase [candidate division KSB1 bacterium]|nr:MAG: N-acetylmuramoyl-L-alanine amidase [candidate division KSB1 bacterium]
MKLTLCVFSFLITVFAAQASGADIRLIYPRVENEKPIVYPVPLDSTFVLGNVTAGSVRLQINGQDVPLSEHGAFLAWLPLRKMTGQTSWELSLLDGEEEIASHSCPYQIESNSSAKSIADTTFRIHFPRVLEVTVPNGHIRTAVQGTYHIFPEVGCRLSAVECSGGFFLLDLGNGFPAAIDTSFVEIRQDSILSPILLGNGVCRRTESDSRCSFALAEPVAWHSEVSSDGQTLVLDLFRVASAVNRIRYDVEDPLIRDIVWEQKPYGVTLSLNCRNKVERGYEIEWREDSLRVSIRKPFRRGLNNLKGKKIVVDAGHGGKSTGAIGPLGTNEKDVTLKWAQILKHELEDCGAVVNLTRAEDADLGLYDRIDTARKLNADFLLSLHCNALPDNENPLTRHGSSTYYYQSHSRSAAEILHKALLKASGLPDDGLYDANLALVRPTLFPSVLIEGAYIIYPPEEEQLQTEAFLRRLSKGLTHGLTEYFKTAR